MSDKEMCPRSYEHKTHMCQLKHQEMMEELDRRSTWLTVVCAKCGVKANDAAYLCNPRLL